MRHWTSGFRGYKANIKNLNLGLHGIRIVLKRFYLIEEIWGKSWKCHHSNIAAVQPIKQLRESLRGQFHDSHHQQRYKNQESRLRYDKLHTTPFKG